MLTPENIRLALQIVLGLIALGALICSIFTVEEQSVYIIERFGKFHRIAQPGLRMRIPGVDQIAGDVSFQTTPLTVDVQTKTKDNVFVQLSLSIQYKGIKDKAYEAFYSLDEPEDQMGAFAADTVRSAVPRLTLDQVFEAKDSIESAALQALKLAMEKHGWLVEQVLVLDIDPADEVKAAMNEINTAQRLRVAAEERGEADRILKVKAAQAEAESMALQGKGVADQRAAIVAGLQASVQAFTAANPGVDPKEVMATVMMTQYFDTLRAIGGDGKVLFVPHSPAAVKDIGQQILQGAELAAFNAAV